MSGKNFFSNNALEALAFLFRYATKLDVLLFSIGLFSNLLHGISTPVFIYIFGRMIDSINTLGNTKYFVLITFYIGFYASVSSFLSVSTLNYFSTSMCNRIKDAYFKNIIKQEIAWFDDNDPGSITSRLDITILQLNQALSLKFGQFVLCFVMFFGSYLVAFLINWKMTLVISSSLIPIALNMILVIQIIGKISKTSNDAYAEAGAVAEEAIHGIRTITSLSAQVFFQDWYGKYLTKAKNVVLKLGIISSAAFSFMDSAIFLSASLGLYYGGVLLSNDLKVALETMEHLFSAGDIIIVTFSIVIAGFSLAQAKDSISTVLKGLNSLIQIKEQMSRVSKIDSSDPKGIKDIEIKGDIEFHNVSFTFPTRPEAPIFNNLSFKIHAGDSVAFVGPSGIGKSTIIQLLQRFYDPDSGYITIDGIPLTDFNLKWLRSKFGIVSQQPRLFATSVKRNIELGSHHNPTERQVIKAATDSLAHNFIMRFPHQYNTFVGDGGSQLSGGQKQRIAIARALIRNPKFLLFDEATSALDNRSEKLVQKTLERLVSMKSHTSIVIAHRLSTIKNSSKIIVLNKPDDNATTKIAQIGTHSELMLDTEGVYYALMNAQNISDLGTYSDNPTTFSTNEDDSIASKVAYDENNSPEAELDEEEEFVPRDFQEIENKSEKSKNVKKSGFFNFNFKSKNDTVTNGKNYSALHTYFYLEHHLISIFIGVVSAIFSGGSFPLFGFALASYLSEVFTTDPDYLRERSNYWALFLVILAAVTFFTNAIKNYFLELSSEYLVKTLRAKTFKSILHQEIEFFDNQDNSPGILTTILSGDIQAVKNSVGSLLGDVIKSLSILIFGLVVAMFSSIKLSLVNLVIFTLFFPGSVLEQKFMMGDGLYSGKNDESSSTLSETLSQIRNVVTLGIEEVQHKKYKDSLTNNKLLKNSIIAGAAWSYSQGGQFAINCLTFLYGDYLIRKGEITQLEFFRVYFILMFATMGISQATSFFTDLSKSKGARNRIFNLLYRKSRIDSQSNDGIITDFNSADLKEVEFYYSQRPDIKILNNVSLNIQPRKTIAIVGESGCGKSTIIQLLERFYDCNLNQVAISIMNSNTNINESLLKNPEDRGVFLNGVNIKDLNLRNTRKQLGLVSQDPILFNTTIAMNIKLGRLDASYEEIEEAAKIANAHSFIDSLPDKYDTVVGRLGEKLSGGQKQRIAIARSILSNPNILLLDEATSALDNESEKVVQQALDELVVKQPRTTVVIAHRFSTITNADHIIVLKASENLNGSYVAESGTHHELLDAKGEYFKLYSSQ